MDWLAFSSSVTSLVSESTSELFRVDDCEEYLLLDLEIFFFLMTFLGHTQGRNQMLEAGENFFEYIFRENVELAKELHTVKKCFMFTTY